MSADYEVSFFLNALGYTGSEAVHSSFDDFRVQKLSPEVGRLFGALNDLVLIASVNCDGIWIPISLLYIPKYEAKTIGVTSLVHPEHRLRTWLELTVPKFFNRDLLKAVNLQEWMGLEILGVFPCPVFWEERPLGLEYENFFSKHFEKMPKLPVFPTVYPYNNPYAQKTFVHCMKVGKPDDKILVMGCGASIEAAALALQFEMEIHATDINPLAIANTKLIADYCGVGDWVKAWVSDGYAEIQSKYDLIILNAPLVSEEDRPEDPNRFDVGGKFLKTVLQGLPNHLQTSGRLILMSRADLSPYIPPQLLSHSLELFNIGTEVGIHELSVVG